MLDLRQFKEVMVSYGYELILCEAETKFMGNSEQNFFKDSKDLATEHYWNLVLSYSGEYGGKRKLQQNRARGVNIFQDQFLGEGQYTDLQNSLDLMITPWPCDIQQL